MNALSKSETRGEFSVYWWDPKDCYYAEKKYCGGEEAVKTARALVSRPAAKMGIFKRIIITDGGDCCCFEWRYGEGVVFPKQEKRRIPQAGK